MRRAAPVALLLALSFVLSACTDLDIDARVGRDQTVSGTIEAAIDRDEVSQLLAPYGVELDEEDPLSQVIQKETLESLEDRDDVDVTIDEFNRGDVFGFVATFDDLSMKEFTQLLVGDDPRYVFERDGDEYKLVVEGSEEEVQYAQQSGVDLTFSLTFPGDIVDTDGDVDNRTVTWSSYEDVADGIFVTSEVPLGASDVERVWTGAGLAIVLVIAAGCAFAWRRPRG